MTAGMAIRNDRNEKDYTYFYNSIWSGMLVGTDGYPSVSELGDYYIAGGKKSWHFKAAAIEFYGVKTQT